MENQHCNKTTSDELRATSYRPADRLATVSEYYFSRKLKEVAQMNAQGMDVRDLMRSGTEPRRSRIYALRGYPRTAQEFRRVVQTLVWCRA